jgi:four helix bundle protein
MEITSLARWFAVVWHLCYYMQKLRGEPGDDFIHKMTVVLKELKETRACLKLIKKKKMSKPVNRLSYVFKEGEELIKITGKSIETIRQNKR